MPDIEKKGVGVKSFQQIHHTDHMAVYCIMMGIPLIFVDDLDYELGAKYYPGLQAIQEEFENFNPEFLIANYDVFFMSDLWDRKTFRKKFQALENKYQKRLRNVHCPHGFSDKNFYIRKMAREDILLVYGQNMLDMLKHEGVFEDLNSYIIMGNPRYTYFKEHQAFYDDVMEKDVLSKFNKKQPVILYAPTWQDFDQSSTFFDHAETLLSNLPDSYNMIVKLHPRLEEDNMPLYYRITGRYENKPNILFLKDFPLIYPILAHTDLYIGDMSSIGYDYLAFNKPMFFLNKEKRDKGSDPKCYLFRCGTEVVPDDFKQIYHIIEKTIPDDAEKFTTIRKEVYDYTFGPERPFKDIRADVIHAYNTAPFAD